MNWVDEAEDELHEPRDTLRCVPSFEVLEVALPATPRPVPNPDDPVHDV